MMRKHMLPFSYPMHWPTCLNVTSASPITDVRPLVFVNVPEIDLGKPQDKKPSFTIESILGLDSGKSQSLAVPTRSKQRETTKPYSRNIKAVSVDRSKPDDAGEQSNQRVMIQGEGNRKTISTKTKRIRTIFSVEQLNRLEAEFLQQQYMVGRERSHLASELNLTEAQVKVWFQNRRIKWRKQHYNAQIRKETRLDHDTDSLLTPDNMENV
ncbi:uncharacterized protein LOC143258278 [Tachypleus tridentatus]|uniref:uncharacterized protein LOC143258278 n=1 Tax=Tachypleus tridentatus TaxID=6853 RepID=UPI003FCFDFAE